jgi:hypothetical protein
MKTCNAAAIPGNLIFYAQRHFSVTYVRDITAFSDGTVST